MRRAAIATILVMGCGSEPSSVPADASVDSEVDAAGRDAGIDSDAGDLDAAVDGGGVDAAFDAASPVDAGADADPPLPDAGPIDTQPGTLQRVQSFGSNPGNLGMWEYVPRDMPASAPLVLVLHGCSQTVADYTRVGWNELADIAKFHVVYAEQSSSNNGSRCFNWFENGDTTRGGGELASMVQMIDAARAAHGVEAGRVFVSGLSSGGAMAAALLAAYPDVFAAGAIMSGLPYRCATSLGEAFSCQNGNVSKSAQAWGDLVRAAGGAHAAGGWPRVSLWQGSDDFTVRPVNASNLVAQWRNVHALDAAPEVVSDTARGLTQTRHRDGQGRVRVELWSIDDMGHGVALEPGLAAANGCGSSGSYRLSAGVCSTYYAAEFFGIL